MKKLIWTQAYNPFIMGGDVNAPMGCRIEVGEAVDAGKGFKVHVVRAPRGRTYVIEATTGGIIGNDLGAVQKDILECEDQNFMRRQVHNARAEMAKVFEVKPKKFWRILHQM